MSYKDMAEKSSSSSRHISHWYSPEGSGTAINSGEGVYVYDDDGNGYLDFISSLYCVNAGHDNQKIKNAITEQLDKIPYVSSSQENDARSKLANKLVEVSPDSLTDVAFSVSGSEANELAMQFARKKQDASKILTRWRSYHGSTYGAGSLTGEEGTRNTVQSHAETTGTAKFLPPIAHDSPFDADSPEELAEKAADHVEFVIRNEDPESIAAIFMEPVAGSSGGYPAPPGYFQRLREICDKYDILLVADEVITGFGRCGEMFGMQTEGVEPDMITFAKGVTGAYSPLGGVIMSSEVADFVREGMNIGQTFAGHPTACAAGVAAIEEYENSLIDNVRDLTPFFESQLEGLAAKHDVISEVRGRGFLQAILVENPETGEPFIDRALADEDEESPVSDLVDAAKERGLLITQGRPQYQVMLCPPLCADKSDLIDAMEILDASFEETFGQ